MSAAVRERERGFSYVEVLVALVVLTLCLIPALDALRTPMLSSSAASERVVELNRLQGKLEDILARPFTDLAAAAAAAAAATSPTIFSEGTLRVFLARYDPANGDGDGNPFTNGSPDLLWVRVELENTPYNLETLTTR